MAKKKTNKKQSWSNSLEYRENLYKGVNPSADFDPISLGTQLIGYLGGFRTGQGIPEDEARWAAYLGLPYDKTYAPDSKIRFEGDENYPDRQYQGLSKRAKEEVREDIIPKARRIKNKYNKEWIQVLDTKPNSEYNDATIYHNRQNYLGDLGKFGIREVGNSGIYEVGDKYDFPALIPIPDRNEGTELMVRDTIWSDIANPKLYEEELLRRSNKHDDGGLFNKVRVIGKDEDLKQDTKDAIEWANNWYNARKATGKFDDQLVDLETLSNRPGTIRRDDYLQSAGKYEGSDASFSIRVNPNIPALWGNNKDYKSRLLHEIIHAGTTKRKNKYVSFESSPIFDIISDITGVPAINTTDSQDIHQGLEYYPRLMQMRHEMNADPYKTDYTLPELKYWLKKYNLPADQRGVDMMNKIVYNDNSDVTYAKYGGGLNKYNIGGDLLRPDRITLSPTQKLKAGFKGGFKGITKGLFDFNSGITDKFMSSGIGKGLSNLGINAGNIGGIANTAATAIGGLLAGKNKTGVGSAMQTVGSLASNIPGVGGLIGAGVNLAGGLVNAAFGSNLNQEFIDQTEQAAKQQANYVSSASTNAQLMSDYANMSLLSDVNKDDVGSEGWFSNKATDETERLNALTDAANAKAMASIQRTADNIDRQNDLGLMANYTAYGGPLNIFKDGGIYIKPSHRGRLTELKARTGKTEAELYNDGNPAHKKMVVFARNARKWKHDEGGSLNPYSAGALADAIYSSFKREKYLGKPSHNYDFTISEEEANKLGYYPDERGHRDDRVKKSTHPTHPSRGKWKSFEEFELTDRGMENPNYTLFGLNDGGQDPQAVMTYNGGVVLPEITVTPKGSYIMNPYDNIKIFNDGGQLFTNGVTTIGNGGTHEYLERQEYDVTEEEIKLLKKLGYEFEYL